MTAARALPGVLFDLSDTLVPWHTITHWQWAWRPQGPLIPERHAQAAIKRSLRGWDQRRWQGLVGTMPVAEAADHREFLRATLTEIAGHSLPPTEVEAVVDRFLRPTGEIERFPDAAATVLQIAERGQPVGVVSELSADTARAMLKRAGLVESWLVLSEAGPAEPRLPSAAAFHRACERLGTVPGQTVFVGNLYWSDARAANRAGLTGVLIDRTDIWPRVVANRIQTLSELPTLDFVRPGVTGEPAPAIAPREVTGAP